MKRWHLKGSEVLYLVKTFCCGIMIKWRNYEQTFKIMLAYVGVLTGAALASGQELLQYFVSLGKTGIVGIALV